MHQGEFTGLAVRDGIGSLTGLRAFAVDRLGRLRGPHYTHQVWKPGENIAKCEVDYRDSKRRHPLKNCTCGFYAFTDGSNESLNRDTVGAIVTGYGEVAVGERGFRSEKSVIQAFYSESLQFSAVMKIAPVRALYSWFQDLERETQIFFAIISYIMGVLFGFALATSPFSNMPTPVFVGFAIVELVLIGYLVIFHTGNRVPNLDMFGKTSPIDTVRVNYPDIPVYSSLKAALKDFPLTPSDTVKREKPTAANEPRFWDDDFNG